MSQPVPLPRISIVTPTLNQGVFIERTIRSILDQNYPNLEYIIIDGGSTDNTVEIIKQYADRLAYWCSEPDTGQSNAINKGLKRATGDIVAYLNSDDQLLPGSLQFVAEQLMAETAPWLSGACRYTTATGETLSTWMPKPPPLGRRLAQALVNPWGVPQPACFWRRRLFEQHGYFREDLHYVFDTEFQVRLVLAGEIPLTFLRLLANAFIHPQSKTGSAKGAFWAEDRKLFALLSDRLPPAQRRLGQTVLGLVDIANPQGVGHPAPTAAAFISSLVIAPLFVGRAGVAAMLRRLGLKQWRARF